MSPYFAYTRVSTPRQGQLGVSLVEQRAAITEFADRHHIHVVQWFEETETAARTGRKLFRQMLRELGRGRAAGVVMHKIDRGARNLRDWADIGDLIDLGIDVRFAHDDLRLDSRGGRLAADIQAVIAADYVRNLREEIRKGIQGRLKQGLYPFGAPLGYLDRGTGHAKIPHPLFAPLIRETYERYATGTCSLRSLATEMAHRGLLNRRKRPVSVDDIYRVLHNPFYAGTIRIRLTGHEYPGAHEPLVSRALYDLVQKTLLAQRPSKKRNRHYFAYQRFIRCTCGSFLVGERHKERYVYYRCHHCKYKALREEQIDRLISPQIDVPRWDVPVSIQAREIAPGAVFGAGVLQLTTA